MPWSGSRAGGNRQRAAAGAEPLPVLRFHDLRHGHAVQMLIAGADVKTISGRLGHASITKMDRYLRRVSTLERDAVAAAAPVV